ncbi:MAG TPA: class I SAM-dependent methyltransferase [Gemmatimonadales bacterium]|nr:class I SAM-dependent methyltransferase [Gemmatimonadales bacterium]
MHDFKDHFSETAAAYAAHRPTYPEALVDFLSGMAPARDLAWDSGCGSGQLSVPLAGRFARVIATDASAAQLARAVPRPNVEYRRAAAEASGLPNAVVDLAVAAQAAHWFDLSGYYREVRRAGRPGSTVALVSYGTVRVDQGIDPVIDHFYGRVLAPHWPPERRHVDDGYRSLPFPFDEIPAPRLEMQARWALDALVGYVGTWSAVWAMGQVEGPGGFETFRRELASAWGPGGTVRPVRWPLALRVGRL